MAASDKELEKQLTVTGNKLLDPPSSVEELLHLLDRVEECLSKVEQSPPDSMQTALSPLMKALVAEKLFKHSDVDVKVAVAACISEITRITAPDAPYDDDQMKEVFQLIVSSFENLVDKSSRSYAKRASILETVAKVRSCVVMLDLECDGLINEMFQHFLNAIRYHHPENVFSSMETIMTLVLEESEDVPPELLSPILDHTKKDNEVPQLSRKLAEQVLKNCATKLKPYLTDAVKSSGLSFDGYSNLVASICQGTFGALLQNDAVVDEKDSQGNIASESAAEESQKGTEVSAPEQAEAQDGSILSEVSNGVAPIVENNSLPDSVSTKKDEDGSVMDESRKTDKPSNTDLCGTGTERVADAGQEQMQTSKKKGKQPGAVKQVEASKGSDVKEDTESGVPPESKEAGRDVRSSPRDSSATAAISSENVKETRDSALVSKTLEDETANVTSPSQSVSLPDESRSKKAIGQKKKDSSTKEAKPSADDAAKAASEEPCDSEAKPTKKSGKNVASSKSKPSAATKKTTAEAKPAKQSGKKSVGSDSVQESSKLKVDKKKQGHGKATDEKEASETSSGDNEKPIISSVKSAPKSSKDEKQSSEETAKTNAKRKHSLGKEKAIDGKEYGENLVGSRIKVWWPKDRAFYEGVVDSYDSTKKKHLVLYDDGDQEILNLKREKWELVEGELEPTEDKEADQTGADAKSEMPPKKKAKTGGEQSAKQTKTEASSAKRSGGGSSNKSKAAVTTTKSGKKSKEDGKTESKPKAPSKPEDGSSEESGDDEKPKAGGDATASKATGKKDEAATTKSGSGKSKEETAKKKEETPKSSSSKSKQEPHAKPTASAAAKAKTGKSTTSGKSNVNGGGGKPKSASATAATSSKAKDSEEGESDAEETLKTPETMSKGKSPGSAKAQAKSGKKRKR